MTTKADAVLKQALDLSDGERAEIAAALLESLEPPADTDIESAWRQEIQKRIEQIDCGQVQTVPWSEVRDSRFAKLRDRAR